MVSISLARYSSYADIRRELYKWAATILTSRCFSSSAFTISENDLACHKTTGSHDEEVNSLSSSRATFPVLLPVMDLGNHDPNANVLWRYQGSSYVFVANESLKAGKEVCISYDNKGNEEREISIS